jgi:hypothetical protein
VEAVTVEAVAVGAVKILDVAMGAVDVVEVVAAGDFAAAESEVEIGDKNFAEA